MNDRLIQIFKEIVQIDSVSGEEKEVSEYIQSFLKKLNADFEVDEQGMILVKLGKNPTKMFCAHLDTVQPGRGIVPDIKDGYLVSNTDTILGADNKVPVAIYLYLIEEYLTSGSEVPNAEFLFTVREETNSGISGFGMSMIKSKVAYIFDIANQGLGVCVKKGPTMSDFIITAKGRSVHASIPQDGINVLDALNTLLSEIPYGRIDPQTTLNLGMVKAGDVANTVPGELQILGDLRSNNTDTFDKVKAEIDNSVEQINKKFEGEVDIEWIPYTFGYELNLESENLKALISIYKDLGIDLKLVDTTSGSDAGYLNKIGIETFCLGDGVVDSHKVSERIAISDFEKLIGVVSRIVESK